jgi:hypothetical protein
MKKLMIISLALCLVLIFSFPVQSKESKYKSLFNLATQTRYYRYVDYKSQYKSNHLLFFTIIDDRPQQERVFNKQIQWFHDEIWTEPPVKMIGKILLKEIRSSNIFKAVEMDERNPSLVLELKLNSLVGHYGEGRVARGTVKIHAILKSAKNSHVVLERDYEETSSTLVGRFINAYRPMFAHIGIALHNVVESLLMDLENTLAREGK